MRLKLENAALGAVGALLFGFLAAPILSLFFTANVRDVIDGLRHPLVWPALRLSVTTTVASSCIVVFLGTPLAWRLSRSTGRGARALETIIQLPIVIPPAVAGVALLLAFGRRGLFSGLLYPTSWSVSFTTTAVVMAEIFVSAPFYVQSAIHAFRRIDPSILLVARTFGASPLRVFFRLAIPLAAHGLLGGAAMSWARAMGEFGATLMFAGNLQGRTQTLPLAIYTALESDLRTAQALSIFLVISAFALLLIVRAGLSGATRPESEPRA
ncbi:MAG: molybdate ABC transporter permease subunit [Myxococcales bacterium]|nr:molybdate ABC transporter permease subunit [Myxococcales bacterium]